jgi:Zn-dependent protease
MMAISAWVGFGIGWGKPVLTNPRNFKNPRRDQGLVAIAGPISNILQATVFAGLFSLLGRPEINQPLGFFLISGVTINLALAFFNLIPLAPLDGHWIVTAMLPYEQARRYFAWMQQYGQMVFIGLIILEPQLRIISSLIRPPMMFMANLLLR